MNRQQKEAVVADFKDMFLKAQASFLVKYKGLNVQDMGSLRKVLRDSGGKLKITKARLMKIASEGVDGVEPFRSDFKDQVGIVFAMEEVPPVAKGLVEFAKGNKSLEVVSGFFESKILSKGDVEFFAALPSKDVLYAQLARALQGPITGLARVLNAPIQQLATVLQKVSEVKEG